MKSMKRAERRHNKQRMIQRAFEKYYHGRWIKDKSEAMKFAVKKSDHLADCNCYMCANPRKIWKQPTLQEVVAKINFIEQKSELG